MSRIEDTELGILKEKYALSEDDFNILFDIIKDSYTRNVLPSKYPIAVILGAQPGAGKTELQIEAQLRISNNIVVCNADNFRDFHPKAVEIKKAYPDAYPAITAGYAQRWNDKLCQYCRGNKLNYILETTFQSGDRINATITEMKGSGYEVDIMLLAVDPRLSLLGTHLRYESMLEASGTGRKVSLQDHNVRVMAIPYAIDGVQKAHLYDNLYIYARSIVIEGATQVEGVMLVARNPVMPKAIYEAEINRPWPEKLNQYYKEQYGKVLSLMNSRNAAKEEIESFKETIGLEKQHNQQRAKRKGPHM